MATIWEELSELPEDELVIRLVKAKYGIRHMNYVMSRLMKGCAYEYDCIDGEIPPDERMEKIVAYIEKYDKNSPFMVLDEYGVDNDFAMEYIHGPWVEDGKPEAIFGNKERRVSDAGARPAVPMQSYIIVGICGSINPPVRDGDTGETFDNYV